MLSIRYYLASNKYLILIGFGAKGQTKMLQKTDMLHPILEQVVQPRQQLKSH